MILQSNPVNLVISMIVFCVGFSSLSTCYAEQYRSRAIIQDPAVNELQSIAELEKALSQSTIDNDYSRATAARYLARHYAQGNTEKAIQYYQQSLSGEGLSPYAKQPLIKELAILYSLIKQYDKLLALVEQAKSWGIKLDGDMHLFIAEAHHHSGEGKQAINALNQAQRLYNQSAMEQPKHIRVLKRMRYILFYNEAYHQAAKIQQQLIAKLPNQWSEWRFLTDIYLKTGNYKKAAESLSVAYQNGLPLNTQDMNQLIALYAQTHNPYSAARLMDEAIAIQKIKDTADIRKQQTFLWLKAKEPIKAAQSLARLIVLQPSTEHYLFLAEIYQSLQDWAAMKQAVIDACEFALPHVLIGRANVLLGVSELKQGQYQQARYAFINATLVGGQMDIAQKYLDYMALEFKANEELTGFKGACTPSWVMASDFLAKEKEEGNLTDQFFTEAPVDFGEITRVDYSLSVIEQQTWITSSHQTTLREMEKTVKSGTLKLARYIGRGGGKISGALHIILTNAFTANPSSLTMTLAFPVSKTPLQKGRFREVEDSGFFAAVADFEGKPETLYAFINNFHSTALEDGLLLTGELRQVISKTQNKDRWRIQVQLGVKQ